VSYAVVYDELLFLKQDSGYRARYVVVAILYDEGGRQVTGDTWRREVFVDEYEQTNSRRFTAREELELAAPPGEYLLKVQIRSPETSASGQIERLVEVPEIAREGVTLGTIVFEREGPGPDTDPLLNPAREYGEESPVVRLRIPVYAEAGTEYELEVSVETSSGDVMKSFSDTLSHSTFLEQHVRTFGVLDLEVGNYFAVVRVDRAGGGDERVRRARFKVVTSPRSWGEDFDKMIAQISYVASRDDIERLLAAPPERRDEAWDDFWRRNDPDPATEENEFKQEFLTRLSEANARFKSVVEGWQTDMGRVFIRYGEPDDVESQPVGRRLNAWETWYYYSEHTKFVFVDREGFGEFKLVEKTRI
ncbi:MAG: GWxTD domain-containing protein, partial [Candidatus Eisenbacteria bacterium]|nr:GWxTD domain-containing protein [Candidatus Eisenbacteria bacterium]